MIRRCLLLVSSAMLAASCSESPAPAPTLTAKDIPAGVSAEVREKIEGLLSPDADARASAAFRLAPSTMGPPEVVRETQEAARAALPFLVQTVDDFAPARHPLSGQETTTAEEALFALIQVGSPAVEPLIATLADKDSRVRRGSAEALGWIEDPSAIAALVERLGSEYQHGRPDVRRAIVFALRLILVGGPNRKPDRDASHDAVAIEAMRIACRDRDPGVRELAEDCLKALGPEAK